MSWETSQKARQRRQELKAKAIAYKGGRCAICHYDRCPAALDFHHVLDLTKEFTIAGQTSWDKVRREIDQCELVCANCHREIHDGLHPQFLDLHLDDIGDFGTEDF